MLEATTLYSLSPSCISLLSKTIKISGLDVAMAQVAGPTQRHKAHVVGQAGFCFH